MTADEIADLIAPHPSPPATIWVLPISTYTRRETCEGDVIRYG
jgi:hypothetical protein